MMQIGTYIKTIRENKKYSQEKMASVIGISKKQYGRLERNETDCKLGWIQKLIYHFGDDVREFFVRFLLLTDESVIFPDISSFFLKNEKDVANSLESINRELGQRIPKITDEIFYEYLEFKLNDDNKQYEYFIENKILYLELEKQNEILPILIFTFKQDKIKEILRKLSLSKKNEISKSTGLYIYTYMNGVGELVKKFVKRNSQEIERHLVILHEKILATNYHFLLPIYYRHKAIYYLKIGDNKLYAENKEQALQLSKIFNQWEIFENISNE